MAKSTNNKPNKQKNLFSFFKKKDTKTEPTPPPPKPEPPKTENPPISSLKVGSSKIEVYWPNDDEWYACVVRHKYDDGRCELFYPDDGEVETVRMEEQIWRMAGKNEERGDKRSGGDEEEEFGGTSAASKRRRILESSDESFAMEEDDEDDSFKCDVESDEESFKADDDEEEETLKPKAKPTTKPKAKVTVFTPRSSTPKTTEQPKRIISNTPNKAPRPTPNNLQGKLLNPTLPLAGQVNARGTHLHNHLNFFANRRDLNGHPSTHPDYSPFNMKVDYAELEKVCKSLGATLSPAQRQWWEIKSQYANCVLLFKTGKFYEMFHDDADIADQYLDFVYMKGVLAHGGFPEAGLADKLDKLVKAGFRVARVEQTETPDGLKERKKKTAGKKPQVVAREVCEVTTNGTRTYCYLDDNIKKLEEDSRNVEGPLVVIKETKANLEQSDAMDTDEDSGPGAVYEYGVTIVDAITATVTLGQFADDILRSRMQTLLTTFSPSEVMVESGENGASKTLLSLIKSACPKVNVGKIGVQESFPKSTAIKAEDRTSISRLSSKIHPWSVDETIAELHRKGYYPRGSKNATSPEEKIARWPDCLKACIQGGATLALSSLGAALFYLQSNLVDDDILSMALVKAYIPPNMCDSAEMPDSADALENIHRMNARQDEGVDLVEAQDDPAYLAEEANIDHMALDGTALSNLEILHNLTSGSFKGSLLSKIDFTKSPHGSRLLRAWLLRPLFIKAEIDRRADAVAELSTGSAAIAMNEARTLLKDIGDIERLLSRVHSMGGVGSKSHHPNDRAIFYENDKHTKRKVEDFSKLLNGLKAAAQIPEKFDGISIASPLLEKLVRTTDDGGCIPADLHQKLDWFFDNFDLKKAANGNFEPSPGISEDYDAACETISSILHELNAFKQEMCASIGQGAKSSWKYINIKEDSKDKYLIELRATIQVPDSFEVKGKRGKGQNQINKYRCPEVESLVKDYERMIDIKNEVKAGGIKAVFAKFDLMRETWNAATMATAMLDAIGSLATLAGQPGYCRPRIVECPANKKPGIKVVQGRHPCVDVTHTGGSFIANDLTLGGQVDTEGSDSSDASILLLSGPNMGGKSTLLRQTCLITILAQIGSFVPAEECSLTPVDRIFTRLGASDRILCGQSTFFVELAETAAAVRGATRRSLVIMDELGRGTSTFDGTAIASATVKHLVERSKCVSMFATHYHSLLEDWKDENCVRLGHMECIVEEDSTGDEVDRSNITFLYTLGDGPCPKSFGVNVARLAGLPDDVLTRAKKISAAFEAELKGDVNNHKIIPSTARSYVAQAENSFSADGLTGLEQLQDLWKSLQ